MTKEQELKLFGSVEPTGARTIQETATYLGIGAKMVFYMSEEELESLLELARTQREAIGALIETAIFTDDTGIGYDHHRNIEIILSVVLQDTWEQVREAWEENT